MCTLDGEESRKGQASEGPELGLIHFIHSVEIQSVCVCVCVRVQKVAGKDRHLKGRSLGSYTSYTQWRSRVRVCVCVCVQKEAGKDRHLKGRSLGSHTSHIE